MAVSIALEYYQAPDLKEVWVNVTNIECLSVVRETLGKLFKWEGSSVGILTDEAGVSTEWMTLHGVTL